MPADPLELTQEGRRVADVAQPLDRGQQRADRARALRGDGLHVHEGSEQVADLARVLVDVLTGLDPAGELR